MRNIFLLLVFLFSLFITSTTILAADVENLAGYGFAKGDSYDGENSIPLAAVDGVVDRFRWRPVRTVRLDSEKGVYVSSSSRISWLQVEFEIPTEIVYSKIYWSQERAAKDYYKLLHSDDGENWTEVSNFSVERQDGSGSVERPIIDTITFDTVKAKYFRVEISAGETKDGLGAIYEFELYGDPSQYDYLKKVDNKDVEENVEEVPKPKKGLKTSEYIAIGIGVAAVAVAAVIVSKLKGKGDGINA